MTTLFQAMNNTTTTTNGMAAHINTHDPVLDFFAVAASSRGKCLMPKFKAAFAADPQLTARALLWLRDIRGGAGERSQFRNLLMGMTTLRGIDEDEMTKFICMIPEVGRWDDLLSLFYTPYEKQACLMIADALLREKNALCAKWMPRQASIAARLAKHLELGPKAYRKLVVGLTNVVETSMCNSEWDKINYEHVPSVASARYMTAFHKHDPMRYQAYKDALVKGTAKINAGAIFPHDIVQNVIQGRGSDEVSNAQWAALPNYLEGSVERILPVVDVSSSMTCPVGGNPNLTCMTVAIALGLYLSERITGAFQDTFLTFHIRPEMFQLKGTLQQRVLELRKAPWGGSTDLQKTFYVLLETAKANAVPASEMPTVVVILSDMQFNRADGAYNQTAQQMLAALYADSGYILPRIVYWNLNANNPAQPVTAHTTGAALVSGFSPSIMKGVLKGGSDSRETMLDTLMVDRYNFLTDPKGV